MSTLSRSRFGPGANTAAAAAKRGRKVRGVGRQDRAALALAYAKRALQASRKVERQRELKFHEGTLVNLDVGVDVTGQWPSSTGAVIGNGGAVLPLTTIPQGVAETQRVGERVQVKQIEIRGHFTNNYMAAGALRMIVFRDKQLNSVFGAQATPATVLQVTRTNSLYLYDNIDRWEVYSDQTVEFNKPDLNGYYTRTGFQFKKKVDVSVGFNSNGTGSADSNGLYCLLLMDYYPGGATAYDTTVVVPAAANYGLIDVTGRVMFTDA